MQIKAVTNIDSVHAEKFIRILVTLNQICIAITLLLVDLTPNGIPFSAKSICNTVIAIQI